MMRLMTPPLPRSITVFKDDNNFQPVGLDPLLKLDQFHLEPAESLFVIFIRELLLLLVKARRCNVVDRRGVRF